MRNNDPAGFGRTGRRSFLKRTAAAAAMITQLEPFPAGSDSPSTVLNTVESAEPWYKKVTRWGQVNITEKDPEQYDVEWWRKYWKKTHTDGVIINAGGIVAYYPSKIPLHRQAAYLKGMDLFGMLCKTAHDDGLAVFARMDSNRAHEEFYRAHPDWFTKDKNGKPYKAGELYVSCIFSPYYSEHIPSILTEIATLYKPEGFTDNSWSGLSRDSICYCENCRSDFRSVTGHDLPEGKDWNDRAYREWIQWNYARRITIWELNNATTRKAGGKDCSWAGMNSGSITGQGRQFRNYREICKRADIIMLDHQSRGRNESFQQNTETGLLVHELLGWDKLMPESMAMYQAGYPTFRVSSKPAAEARLWMLSGIAGGIQPWWHHVAAYHEDRRMYDTAAPVMQWHKNNAQYLLNRKPVASVGVVWSQQNNDYFGRDDADEVVELPWQGIIKTLARARIPYIPVHADDIANIDTRIKLLILPNVGSMSEAQVNAVKQFADKGGNIIATGDTSLYDEWGDPRDDFALSGLFGAHQVKDTTAVNPENEPKLAWNVSYHTYLRLAPELRKSVDGPVNGSEPAVNGNRHPVLKGFEKTDILPFGGFVRKLAAADGVVIPMTFVPQFPVYPPETAWMREPKSDIAAMYISTRNGGSRVVYMPADLDRQYAKYGLPDHGDLLRNVIVWAAGDSIPVKVSGAGQVNIVLYEQQGRMILHVVNTTNTAMSGQPVDELITVGPLEISVKLGKEIRGGDVKLRVTNTRVNARVADGWTHFTLRTVKDHELVVIS